MRSTAHFRSHPIHPALIPFPFAFLIGSVLFDLGGWMTNQATFWHTAGHLALAGIAFGLLAAIPGVVDYVRAVPPNSSGKRRAGRHGLVNGVALVLFGAAWAVRGLHEPPTVATFLPTLVGAALLGYGGWLGGTLVTRNLISVDHRYANAGRWRGIRAGAGPGPVLVPLSTPLEEGQMALVRAGERRLVLARTASGYAAFDDRCTHRGGSLAAGVLIGGTAQCLWHGSQFDCATGRPACGPAEKAIKTYAVKATKGGVEIEL
jgi:uncharacterized membrane protein/nitrite reductase/ring-hydroxylating ferredoxin subunit